MQRVAFLFPKNPCCALLKKQQLSFIVKPFFLIQQLSCIPTSGNTNKSSALQVISLYAYEVAVYCSQTQWSSYLSKVCTPTLPERCQELGSFESKSCPSPLSYGPSPNIMYTERYLGDLICVCSEQTYKIPNTTDFN